MKNFKRTVCLFLALAICLSLTGLVFAAGYDSYPDAAKVTYTEAMDVLTNLGIIAGANGYLNPTDYVTREQAAKMIAYICLGKTAAEALSASASVFEDVEAGRWSAGYISYCASEGIIGGVGDTNCNGKAEFQPTANVTANQFVKMLLCAVGYGVNKEFNGTYWAANTTAYGTKVGAFDGTKATDYNAAATREQAMLYAFNIMTKAMTVSYSSLTGAYYSGSSPLTSVSSSGEYLYTLGYKVYGLYQYAASSDAFGRTYYQWRTSSTKAVSDKYYDTAALTYTAAVTSGTIYTALGSSYAGDASYFLDGDEQSDFTIAKSSSSSVGGNGILTLVYADSDTYDVKIVCITTYLGLITDVDGDDSTVRVYDADGSYDTVTYDAADFSAFAEDAYVLVTMADGEIQSMTAPTAVTGVLTAASTAYIKVDGTAYYKSAAWGGVESAAADSDYDSTYTFYLDAYGYVLGDVLYSSADSAADGYVYVTDSEYVSGLTSRYAAIEVQYPDGDTGVLSLNIWKSGSSYYYANPVTGGSTAITVSSGSALNGLTVPGFYRYVENSDGDVTLKAVSTASQSAAGWISTLLEVTDDSRYICLDGSAALSGPDFGSSVSRLYVNASTVLKVIDEDGDVTSFTGYSAIEGFSSDDGADVLILYSGSIAEEIYVFENEYEEDSTVYGLYTGSYTASAGEYYTFLVDGASESHLLSDDDLAADLSDYSLYEVELEDGVVTAVEPIMAYAEAETVTALSAGNYFVSGGEYHYFADDAVIYDLSGSGSTVSLSKNDAVLWAEDSDDLVVCVYIVN